jgi:long-subunit acyl-CoA synthetase (AMP-forming)
MRVGKVVQEREGGMRGTERFSPLLVQPLKNEGEVQIRSPTVMSGYLGDDEVTVRTTIETFVDGDDGKGPWVRTGDLGRLEENGMLYITDRLKEMIKVKAGQVSLRSHRNLSDHVALAPSINRDSKSLRPN